MTDKISLNKIRDLFTVHSDRKAASSTAAIPGSSKKPVQGVLSGLHQRAARLKGAGATAQFGAAGTSTDPGQQAPTPNILSSMQTLADERIVRLEGQRKAVPKDMKDAFRRDIAAVTAFKAFAPHLLAGVDDSDNPVQLFAMVSHNIRQQRLLTYDTKYVRNVYDLAAHRNGDCESLCKLYAFIAWNAGHKDIKLHQMNRPFNFTLNQQNLIPGRNKGEQFAFVSHTVLEVPTLTGAKCYFDPVFGQYVDVRKFGSDLNQYLNVES
jgi:hypothetical protein